MRRWGAAGPLRSGLQLRQVASAARRRQPAQLKIPISDAPAHVKAMERPRSKLETPAAYSSFRSTETIEEFRENYKYLAAGERETSVTARVAGRITSLRDMGKMLFATVRSSGVDLQLVVHVGEHFTRDCLKQLRASLRVGDIVGAEGIPCRMQRGELSLAASRVEVLAPYVCRDQVVCPDLRGFTQLQDNDVRYRYRFVDMMTNRSVIDTIRKRHTVLQSLREYLDMRHFVEVETPILHTVASGANAKPFVTHHNANNADLFLRVAPELYLKQCVVGGLERVYEIGKVFRNEDADRSHNPEFTTCEFYAAYHTYEDLITMTEDIFRHLALRANGTTQLQIQCERAGITREIDLGATFRRISVYDEIQSASGVELPPPNELNTPKGLAYMSAIMLRHDIQFPAVRTAAKMFDKLIDFFITSHIVEPTFVMDHPIFMSPLAKEHSSRPGLAERFELFINGIEYCNAYSELNDPQEQCHRFQQQLIDRQGGDEEAMPLDETFLKSLQVGLPPTAGWGMGIDRVVMLLSGSSTIRDGIIFPLLRQDTRSHDCKRRHRVATFFDFNHQMALLCLSGVEQEMKRRGFPEASCAHIRELRQTIRDLGQRSGESDLTNFNCGEWWPGLTKTMIRLMCGRPRS
ncbi:lysyl-tRNA synthetase, putative [Trypanosoma brucei brucei TREU927]|uniref:Lysine--tRNA ligase n=1 Tax=Trypanosoma brucei brucei (strain 927/4 GUTat10.1) TaxID=185431 RepID=Q585Q9_TRYB2|nr:lysyl-tRNA synthetase, putative [Trypanosoma brucei brucei TREU927]AAX79696.1 lysyl-tRNA synthetase, putative [Trypanosoma brucei]AAZ11714.1 lysyl-tRNA synthetase, putative [Trypanosoma brucei brucei TREU927]